MKVTWGVDIKNQKQKCGDQHRLFSSYRGPQSRSLGSVHGYAATARVLRGRSAVLLHHRHVGYLGSDDFCLLNVLNFRRSRHSNDSDGFPLLHLQSKL